MSDSHAATHGSQAGAPFTDAELKEFQDSDKAAGGVIILLMTAIFGCLLYTSEAETVQVNQL